MYNTVDASYNIQLHEYGKHMKDALVYEEVRKNSELA